MIRNLDAALVNLVHEYVGKLFDKNIKSVQTVIYKQRHEYYVTMPNAAEIELYEHHNGHSNLLTTFRITKLTVGAVSDCISKLVKDREKTIKDEEA